jgi:Icc-related predicted phosphoesterase
MDPAPVEEVLVSSGVALDGRGIVLGDVGLFGLSGAPLSPLHTPNEFSEDELATRLVAGWHAVQSARWKVLVSHAPPSGTMVDRLTSGMHVGSSAVREFCTTYTPDLVVCGHIHEARGVDHLGQTIVVNPGPGHTGAYGIITMGKDIEVDLRQL